MNSQTIKQLIVAGDWGGLDKSLSRLSNSEYRRMEPIVNSMVLSTLGNDDFWKAYLHLLMFRRQSFLTGILSIKHLAKDGSLDFRSEDARNVADWLRENSPESMVKVARMALPILFTWQQIEDLLCFAGIEDEQASIDLLVKESSPHAYYVLFGILRRACDNQQLVRNCLIQIMKKNDDLSFNMASIVRSYFGIDDIRSTFSLQIEPFELNYLDKSYDNFIHVLQGKRPRI
ncbi:MAG: hypothetical protein MJY95_07405 [Bacteroidaceae bacterium]|nr:hypothetical protein [Bacteroidaceae bacterium]